MFLARGTESKRPSQNVNSPSESLFEVVRKMATFIACGLAERSPQCRMSARVIEVCG